MRPRVQTAHVDPASRPASFEDARLVRQVQSGETEAFAALVRKYQDRIYNLCWRLCGHADDAQDLTQEVFLRAYEAMDSFRGKSGFYTWIYRIGVNLSLSHRRRGQVRAALSLDGTAKSGDGEMGAMSDRIADNHAVGPAAAADRAENHERVAAALLALDADYRAAVVLRDLEGLDYQEIADVLELPVGTIKSRIFRGRMALREHLTGKSGGPEGDAA